MAVVRSIKGQLLAKGVSQLRVNSLRFVVREGSIVVDVFDATDEGQEQELFPDSTPVVSTSFRWSDINIYGVNAEVIFTSAGGIRPPFATILQD